MLDKIKNATKIAYHQFLENNLFEKEQEILSTITNRPEVSAYFNEWKVEYDEEVKKQMQKEAGSDAVEEEKNLEETQEEAVIKPSTGRKKGCWIKGGSKADEQSWSIKLEQKVWNKAFEQARTLDYGELTEFQAKKNYKEMAAALIYKSAEIIGIANSWDSGCQNSFERTMKFAGIDRRNLKKHLYVLDNFVIAKEFQVRGYKEMYNKSEYDESLVTDWGSDDSRYAQYAYKTRTKSRFPTREEIRELREERNELLYGLLEEDSDFIINNFNDISKALSEVKLTLKKIK